MTVRRVANVFSEEICARLIALVKDASPEYESFSGKIVDRVTVNVRWSEIPFFLYRLSYAESKEFLDLLEPHLDGGVITSFRVMHYPVGSRIGRHTDGWAPEDGESNRGIIVKLNDNYKGGELIISKTLVDANIGDAVFYDYTMPHEVKTIKDGERWVVNVRYKE